MPDKTLLITGGNGFIGRRIIEHFLSYDIEIVLLTLEKFKEETSRLIDHWSSRKKTRAELTMVTGDITKTEIGLDSDVAKQLKDRITGAIHLAAAYDLSLEKEVGKVINVDGTQNIIDFLKHCDSLERFGYMSTTAISGDHEGLYRETDYEVGQSFNNYYEQTKFEAEGLVRDAWNELPAIIFRPTVVVGDSETGEIDKIDGPYYLFNAIHRNLHLILPDTGEALCHIEPVDFVAEAFYTIMEQEASTGNCYHLADPDPPTYSEFIDLVCERWGKIKPIVTVPPRLMTPLFKLPGAESLLGVPAESLPYTYLNRQYDTKQMREILDGTGVNCPPVESYVDVMIDYYREHLAQGEFTRERW